MRKFNSRALRQLAEEVVQRFAAEIELAEEKQRDYATSLVRQWITYEGNAMLFLGDRPMHFPLGKTPAGLFGTVPEPGLHGWMKQLTDDWKRVEVRRHE